MLSIVVQPCAILADSVLHPYLKQNAHFSVWDWQEVGTSGNATIFTFKLSCRGKIIQYKGTNFFPQRLDHAKQVVAWKASIDKRYLGPGFIYELLVGITSGFPRRSDFKVMHVAIHCMGRNSSDEYHDVIIATTHAAEA